MSLYADRNAYLVDARKTRAALEDVRHALGLARSFNVSDADLMAASAHIEGPSILTIVRHGPGFTLSFAPERSHSLDYRPAVAAVLQEASKMAQARIALDLARSLA